MKKLLPLLLLPLCLGLTVGCDDIELEDVSINLGGLLRPDYVAYDDYGYYEPEYYEEEIYVEEEFWYDDFGFWP